jgi:Protein of unknown function (DUF3137).
MLHESFANERTRLVKRFVPGSLGLLLLGFILSFLWIYFAALMVVGAIGIAVFMIQLQRATASFKDTILDRVLEEFFEEYSHNKTAGLSLFDVLESELLDKPDRYFANDFIQGVHQGVGFAMSDVTMQRVTSNGKTTTVSTYFRGPVMIFDFHKETKGKLIVQQTRRGKLFTQYKSVALESVDFNKRFRTYATNDKLAFFILTPHFMERMQRLEDEIPGNFYFSFINGKMYVALHNNQDLFEVNMFGTISEKIYDRFYHEIKIIVDLIEELRLNPNL